MPYQTIDLKAVAMRYGVDIEQIRIKQTLIDKIIESRIKKGLTQTDVAKKINKSQSYIAKIESGLNTKNFSFELLLGILKQLGYSYKISLKDNSKSREAA